MKPKVSLVKCETYEQDAVASSVKKSIDLIGGIKKFVKPGEKILIKPNLLGARQPERAITTHPEIVRAIIREIKSVQGIPFIGDSPGGAVKGVERVYIETGMKQLSQEEGARIVNFETSGSFEKEINHPLIKKIHIAKIIQDVAGIINVPKLKTHSFLVYTGAIKNLYGCVPGLRKAEYHKLAPHPDDFSHLLDEIYLSVKDKLRFTLIDGIMGMEGNGPSSGDKRKLDIITASDDAVALDIAVTSLLGLKPRKIEVIYGIAKQRGEKATLAEIDLVGDDPEKFRFENFKFPVNWYLSLIPHWFVTLLGKFIWLKAKVAPEICNNCMMCVESCPAQAIKKQKGEKPIVIPEECISCLCCHELCPRHAIKLERSLLSKILIRR